jgi:hypothetical protein
LAPQFARGESSHEAQRREVTQLREVLDGSRILTDVDENGISRRANARLSAIMRPVLLPDGSGVVQTVSDAEFQVVIDAIGFEPIASANQAGALIWLTHRQLSDEQWDDLSAEFVRVLETEPDHHLVRASLEGLTVPDAISRVSAEDLSNVLEDPARAFEAALFAAAEEDIEAEADGDRLEGEVGLEDQLWVHIVGVAMLYLEEPAEVARVVEAGLEQAPYAVGSYFAFGSDASVSAARGSVEMQQLLRLSFDRVLEQELSAKNVQDLVSGLITRGYIPLDGSGLVGSPVPEVIRPVVIQLIQRYPDHPMVIRMVNELLPEFQQSTSG